jgi:apolipoprotein N-acyltransferase
MKMRKWSKTNDIFQALVVQANVSNEEKIAAEKGAQFQPYVLNLYAQLTAEKLSTSGSLKPDALLWPETALPFPLDSTFFNRPNQKNLQNYLNQWNMVLITGGYSQDLTSKDHLGNSKVRNSIFFF